jgi:predicted transcriptional regulator
MQGVINLSKKISDARLIKTLLESGTQQAAAEKLGITPQTIINRMKNPALVEMYHNAQNELLRATTRKLANASGKSADLLISTMND